MAISLDSDASITSYGVSEQLLSEFEMLYQVHTFDGRLKYYPKTVQQLAQYLVCRHYGNLCYELSHLNWAIINVSTKANLLDFYWVQNTANEHGCLEYFAKYISSSGPLIVENDLADVNQRNASPTAHKPNNIDYSLVNILKEKQHLNKALLANKSELSIEERSIKIQIHSHCFSINCNRINLFSCFMEWLVGFVPDLLENSERELLSKGHNAIKSYASELQKKIYAYLSTHLPPAKLQQKYRFIDQWYKAQKKQIISDNAILQFWRENNQLEGYGKFSNVVRDSFAYANALDTAQIASQVQYAYSTYELESNEPIEINTQNAQLFQSIQSQSAMQKIEIESLLSSPKAINKQQYEWLLLATNYPRHIVEFSHTWLRAQCFGKYQNQVIQSVRDKHKLTLKQPFITDIQPPASYSDVQDKCIKLIASNQQVLLAIAQLLLPKTPHQACLILVKLCMHLPKYHQHHKTFIQLLDSQEYSKSTRLGIPDNKFGLDLKLIKTWQLEHPWLNELIGQSEIALKQINRQGFTASTTLPETKYMQSAERLFDVNGLIKQLLSKMISQNQMSVEKFSADRLIFVKELRKLYVEGEN